MSDPRATMHELQRMADRVCVLILSSDLPAIDIEIEKSKVRDRCLELYPDREQLADRTSSSICSDAPAASSCKSSYTLRLIASHRCRACVIAAGLLSQAMHLRPLLWQASRIVQVPASGSSTRSSSLENISRRCSRRGSDCSQ